MADERITRVNKSLEKDLMSGIRSEALLLSP